MYCSTHAGNAYDATLLIVQSVKYFYNGYTGYFQKHMKKIKYIIPVAFSVFLISLFAFPSQARAEKRPITFPVIGSVSYHDDFGAPRSGGRTHEGNDMIGRKLMPLVAAVDGTVRFVPYPEPSYGYYVSIEDADDYSYVYIHINNDTPGTDDDRGGGRYAYAPGMESGNPVKKGQLIGFMGDSGNAEATSAHLHFEIHRPDGTPFSPYESLQGATRVTKPTIAPILEGELLPYAESTIGARIAIGNVDTDPEQEIVSGTGPGGTPQVRVLNQNGLVKQSFFAYDLKFRGGMDVAVADVDGDGIDEIITSAGKGGGPHIRIFHADGKLWGQFFAYPPQFRNGLSVAAADLNNDGRAEILTGMGPAGDAQVKVFSPKGKLQFEFLAYPKGFGGGVDVAAFTDTEESSARIVTGAGPGGGPHVRIFDAKGIAMQGFFPYDKTFRGGVRVSIGNIDSDTDEPEIVTIPGDNGDADVHLFELDATEVNKYRVFERWWRGSFDIAAGTEVIYASSGPGGRRASIREVTKEVHTQSADNQLLDWISVGD